MVKNVNYYTPNSYRSFSLYELYNFPLYKLRFFITFTAKSLLTYFMNLHEYQGKSILKQFGVPIQEGIVANTVEEAVKAAKELQKQTGTQVWVVKAQIHAGGRGKAGGVKVATSLDAVKEKATAILGMNLVSRQTGPQGKIVHKILNCTRCILSGPGQNC